jgi:hypothetical protein
MSADDDKQLAGAYTTRRITPAEALALWGKPEQIADALASEFARPIPLTVERMLALKRATQAIGRTAAIKYSQAPE